MRSALFAGLVAIAAAVLFLPASATAAPCPVNPGNATSWIGGDGSFGDSANWSNGTPTSSCDVSITSAGSDTVTMTAGANVKSLTLGGLGSTPKLIIKAQSPNTNLDAQPAGITIAAGASVTLTCEPLPTGCLGGSSGGAHLSTGASPLLNAGTIRVDSDSGTGAVVDGVIANTGTIAFENSGGAPYSASLGGKVTNQGTITVGNGGNVVNQGSSCGGTEPFVKNDAGGVISGIGTGVLNVINFEQGDGTTEDVFVPCGSVKYSGDGASEVLAGGGFDLSGEMQENQGLVVSASSSNTNVALQSDFTNKGSITLTCPAFGCFGGAGGGAGFNVNGKGFVNAGTFTVAGSSGTGAGLDSGSGGTITNTGTMSFAQSAFLRGVVVNKGKLDIADGKVVTSPAESCGNTGPRVVNDTGGSINATGSGFLSVVNYEQGNGTTSGALPVQIPCGTLKYTGSGKSTIRVFSQSAGMTGDIAAGQTLRVESQVNTAGFTNAGTIVFDQSAQDAILAFSGDLTNTGKIEVVGPSTHTASIASGQIKQSGAAAEIVVPAGTKLNPGGMATLEGGTLRGGGTISGTLHNGAGVVKPGDGIGTLAVTGSYIQDANGRLEIEVGGTGAGQHDALAVSGVLGVGGTLALIPTGGFESSAAIGDTIPFLAYNDFGLGGEFGQTTVTPALPCGKAFATSDDSGANELKATVVAGNPCPTGGGKSSPPPPPALVPNTKIGIHPGAKIFTKKAKVKVKIAFTSDVAGATFECKLDKAAYKPCRSPKSFQVKPGKHKLSVRAVGPGGTDATPATTKFKVIRQKG
jgi:fibronectin-binding autotransporter adhesin